MSKGITKRLNFSKEKSDKLKFYTDSFLAPLLSQLVEEGTFSAKQYATTDVANLATSVVIKKDFVQALLSELTAETIISNLNW